VADQKSARVTVARVLRPHGRRGEVAAEILTDFPDHLTRLTAVELCDGRGATRPAHIHSCRLTQSRGGQAIFHFEGSDSISDAEKLVGLEVQIPFADRIPLPAGSYYVTDLIGCEVRELPTNAAAAAAKLGCVTDVQFTGEHLPGTPILVVDSPRGELLIPLAHEICVRIDPDARQIDVALPEGLRDLNEKHDKPLR
jgi:16S rRNA processing protein RimM